MFEAIQELWPDLNPFSVSIDFEQAAITAVRSTFPNCEIFGCFFHLTKNLRRKLANENLLRRYNTDPNFALAARMIVALAFVPIDDLDIAVDELANSTTEVLMPIIDWFEEYYIGRRNYDGTRRQPMFSPNTWSVYDRTLNGVDRTNNYVEAAHRRLQAEFGMDHPNIWKFIDGIRVVQKGRDQVYEQFLRGDQPPSKRRRYVEVDTRIRTIMIMIMIMKPSKI